jgi:RNA polymerase sigma-70 factor, ECF subfamily
VPDPSDEQPAFDLGAAFDAHGGALFGFALNALRDPGLAEDCVQEVFLRAWRSRDRFDARRAGERTWLFVIARSVIVDVQRSLQRMPRIAPAEDLDLDVRRLEASAPDHLDRLQMSEALAKLSAEHRSVIVAVHLRGATYAELSASTGIPVATLRTRAFYALRALRTHLHEEPS